MSFGKRIDVPGGHRRKVRNPIMLPVAMSTWQRSHTVDLLDLSDTGAKLQGEQLPDVGTEVLVRTGGLEAFGTVVWCEDGPCGVCFDVELSPEATAREKSEGGVATLRGLTAQERLAANDWAHGLAR
jgi:hypothetical protein